jgi:hypothetical protein
MKLEKQAMERHQIYIPVDLQEVGTQKFQRLPTKVLTTT